jgi:translation initiation factor 3 subunit B
VIKFTEVERFAHVAENFVKPVLEEYKPRSHLKSWLADPQGRDQMIIYQGDDVKVAWHGRNGAPDVAHKRTVSSTFCQLIILSLVPGLTSML